MRKSVMIGIGLASATVIGVAWIASANAATGSVTGTPRQQATTTTTTVSKADAERIALAAVQGSTVVETRLDSDNGRTLWNVHLSTPGGTVEVKVDTQTGTVRLDDRDGAPSTGPSMGDVR